MEFQNILYEKSDALGIVTLNRPARQNALSIALLEEMNRCLAAVAESREVKTLVIRAAGRNFCAGHDLSDLAGREIAVHNRMFAICSEMMLRLQRMPQPVIAQVQGIATAAGCQ
ncbi:MAG TPA: enoyl-CoA hydratase-related protein, partial [Syntrophales bacterium]|nr:enoyl-CoA hydratase-related protein [Syntrophales bacterium]